MRNLYFRFYKYGRRRAFARDEQLPIQNRLSCGVLLDVLENGVLFLLLHLLSHARIVYGHTAFSHIRYVSFAGGVSGHKRHSFDCKKLRIVCASVLAVIILNLAFLDSDMDFGRNLPVFSKAPGELLLAMPRYGLWLGDLFPFVFVRLRNKKMPYLTLGIASTWTIANLIVLIGVALYGNALKMVKDLLIHIASFNQLSLEIGRMEWTNLFAIILMSLYSLSFLFDGANEACKRALGTSLPSKIICPTAVLCSAMFSSSLQEVTDVALGTFGYVLSAVAILFPIALFAIAKVQKTLRPHLYACLDAEYEHDTQMRQMPDSKEDGVLFSQKQTSFRKGEAQ